MRAANVSLAFALLSLLALGACTDRNPTAPSDLRREGIRPQKALHEISASTPAIALIAVQVSGKEIATRLLYNLPLIEGKRESALSIPYGDGYQLDIRGYDRNGVETHRGSAYLDKVAVGDNEPFDAKLEALDGGEAAALHVSLVGTPRAKPGTRLIVQADRKKAYEGDAVHLTAYAVDEYGNRLDADLLDFHWAIDDPLGGRLDPARPNGPSDKYTSFIGKYRPERFPTLTIVYLDITFFLQIIVLPNPYVDLSAGDGVTCGLRSSGSLFCWGDNYEGMLGSGRYLLSETCPDFYNFNHNCSTRPLAVAGGRSFTSVSVGVNHVCAVERTTAAAFCWGRNDSGQLGFAASPGIFSGPSSAVQPPAGSTTPLAFTSISAGNAVSCGITTTQALFCWGYGIGAEPVQTSGTYRSVSVASTSRCTLDTGARTCAGWQSSYDFLGQATTATHFCQISGGGRTECWGSNTFGKLGNGTSGGTVSATMPTQIQNFTFQSVSTGEVHSCALSGAAAFCWGHNLWLELGTGRSNGSSTTPQAVMKPTNANPQYTKISVGSGHSCALDNGGDIWCWGLSNMGQLGIGVANNWLAGSTWPQSFAGVGEPSKVVAP